MENEIIEQAEYLDSDGTWKPISIYGIRIGMTFRVPELELDYCVSASETFLNDDGVPTIQIIE
jgi:hypothetical protein